MPGKQHADPGTVAAITNEINYTCALLTAASTRLPVHKLA